MSKPTIYIYSLPHSMGVVGLALAEDGTGLASHLSSNAAWAQHDMGLTSNWKHKHYDEHYPDGYKLEWVPTDQLDDHSGFQQALQKNKAVAGQAEGSLDE